MSKIPFRNLLGQLEIRLRHCVPMIHQTESAECGLACLAMICGYHGKSVDLIALRREFNLSARGATLSGLIGIAEQMGLTTRALSLDIDEISSLKMPCILHWDFNHFVVLVSVRRNRVMLHDPLRGRRTVSLSELSKNFTGVALEVSPTSQFSAEKVESRMSFRTLLKGVHGLKSALGKIFCLSLVFETINLVMPVGTQLVMDHTIPAGDKGLLSLICAGLIFFILLRAVIGTFRAWTSLIMTAYINVQWQSGLFNHLLNLPLGYFERRKLGDIQSRFGSLDSLRSTFTTSVVGAIMDSIIVTGVLVMMVLYGGWLTWVVICFTTIYVLLRLVTYRYYRQLSEELLVREARSSSYFMETLYGIAAVKIHGMAPRRHAHWVNLEIDTINTGLKVTKMDLVFGGISTMVAACDQIAILWLGTVLVIDNQMTIGMFVAFGAFRGMFSDRVGSLTEFLLQLRMMSLHNERISDIALHPRDNHQPDLPYEAKLRPMKLTTSELSFRFDNQSSTLFSGLNISVSAGECVAIIGSSGIGKSTLLKVLCGLLLPGDGNVEVDGINIQKLGINNYHKMIACVMQDDKLFSGSIQDNICSFAERIDDEWMRECAKASFLHDVIMHMPMGYETLIGELGEGLSGGQKQRLFIARALYKKPAILFMDEATSALDHESEASVNRAIRALNITRIIVAHRKSTIESADRIITLD
ncbi:peptidase domain-containing ABC transporter [Erwinia sp. S59]|uniref:peptidase domain-containing ABC transporter n=1 Tax=Erwinia sp. S59 TaxID=2769340 RepID=UPI0025740ACF|nr:peptidase domain-containing ABC transporter [Erwinia sp. S59]